MQGVQFDNHKVYVEVTRTGFVNAQNEAQQWNMALNCASPHRNPSVPFEQGVGGAQDAVDDVEIPALETVHHLCQQVWPLLGEVFPPNDTDGIT